MRCCSCYIFFYFLGGVEGRNIVDYRCWLCGYSIDVVTVGSDDGVVDTQTTTTTTTTILPKNV